MPVPGAKTDRSEVLDGHGLRGVRWGEAEYARVEVKLGAKRLLDVLSAAEAVLFAFERQVGDGKALILEPLKDDHRGVESFRQGGLSGLHVNVPVDKFHIDLLIHLVGLELVRVF